MLNAKSNDSLFRDWQWVSPVNYFASRKSLCEASHKLFKQIKQNFPLRYLYGESANTIKIQIWVTLIANLLLSVLQSTLQRRWSFSGLATIVRIVLMYYLNLEKFLNQPDADLNSMLIEASESPPEDPENC